MNKGWQPSSLERLEQSKKAKQYWRRKGVNIKIAEPPKFDEIPVGGWEDAIKYVANIEETKTPIEAWVDRWIDELGSIK